MVVDEPQIVVFKGSFKLAAEPRGVARSAALAAAEMVLVSLRCYINPSFDQFQAGQACAKQQSVFCDGCCKHALFRISPCDCNPFSPLADSNVSLSESVASQDQDCIAACCQYRTPAHWWQGVSRLAMLTVVLHGEVVNAPRRHKCMMCCNQSRL